MGRSGESGGGVPLKELKSWRLGGWRLEAGGLEARNS